MLVLRLLAIGSVGAVLAIASRVGAGPPARTQVTIWAPASAFGGATYGFQATAGAMIVEQREVEVAANGEVRVANIATTADPASVQLRDLTEPTAVIVEQRFVPGATTPTEMIARHIGEQVTVVTTKGEVTGTLRAVDDRAIVVETGSGDARRVSVMRRDGFVQDIRLAKLVSDRPALVWRLATKKPGKHSIELAYRATGLAWTADYLAVLDDSGKQIDFSAWATIKNTSGATFERADVTLVTGAGVVVMRPRSLPAPVRFPLPNPIRIAAGDTVQVELVPARVGAKTRPLVVFEAMTDPSPQHQVYPNIDCAAFNGTGSGAPRTEIALELDVPAQTTLPDGRVRLFRRRAGRLEVVSEDQLRSAAGVARIRLSPDTDITGERKALTCTVDERARTLHEKLEVKVENRSAQPIDVVVREHLWRWPVWRVESEQRDDGKKGVRAGAQAQEYRLRIPAKAAQTVTYTAVYTW